MSTCLLCLLTLGVMTVNDDLPEIELKADDLTLTESCRIMIPKETVITDKNDNGVIHIEASDIVVEFAQGSVLRGQSSNVRPDKLKGYGIRINGQANVTLRNVKIRRFWGGVWATNADGLTIEDTDVSDCRRAYLKSTPVAEDSSDWLWPHENDKNDWLVKYGAAVYVEDSSCVRGYSHKVYNRGQDSAGFLVFEQCSDNVFAENSATHGGDGFFGFAGREALGQTPAPESNFDYRRKGNNDNLLIANDFSHAPAHGIEMTFSFGNRFIENRLVDNAICGVWGGFSQETLIAGNLIADNGGMSYGLERGGVNIDHGKHNQVVHNKFKNNKCGVHYWADPKADLRKGAWGLANEPKSEDNLIAGNTFDGDDLAFHFRLLAEATIGPNKLKNVKRRINAGKDAKVEEDDKATAGEFVMPEYPVYGETRPIGARKQLRGRENIIMMEWGPWDHESPLIRLVEAKAGKHRYELHKMPQKPRTRRKGKGLDGKLEKSDKSPGVWVYEVSAEKSGIYPYTLDVKSGGFRERVERTIMSVKWHATFFKWGIDPRKDVDGWRALAKGPDAKTAKLDGMTLKYGFGGPSDQKISKKITDAKFGGDHFGMIAKTKVTLGKGAWQFTTLSDDGIRVTVDGETVIDDWSWHPPKRHTGTITLDKRKEVEIVVEHFEIDVFSTLEVTLDAAK